ncbi:MAG: GTP-binding protein [Planctomycetes bacterium]|nr:GTP-binding protein [Planctomycetota bacterium]
MDDFRIVVAGHVDHGKSTIIGRLLYDTGSLPQHVADKFERVGTSDDKAAFAFVTDQLSEEQEGSFTLDTAEVYFRTAKRDYTLIDTPGHREFLKNMVTGVTRADAAVLVVDADEGPLPQTYLHAYLISMLGVRQVIIAINKMDLVSYDRRRFHLLSQQVSSHLERIGAIPRAVIPVSAQQGDHVVRQSDRMPWNLTPTLVEAMDELVPQEQNGHQPLRFLVQCPFPANNRRAILGRVASGHLNKGQAIVFGPGGHETSVTSVLLGQQEVDMATPGQSVGLFLEDPTPVSRGHVGFNVESAPSLSDRLSTRVFWIGTRSLEANGRIKVLCGTQTQWGRVERIAKVIDPISLETIKTEAACLNDFQMSEIVIRTESPMCIDPFDVLPELGRFAILQDGRIVGGGVIAR